MATLLIAWELGVGLGHVTQLVQFTQELEAAGHRVFAALREPQRAVGLLDGCEVTLLQSPFRPPSVHPPVVTPRTHAHVLWNAGFGDPAELHALTDSWAILFDSVSPDLIIFDHAPTALMAARGRDVKKVVLGNGFCCPPDCTPLPDLRPWMPPMREQLFREEKHLQECMNHVLARRGVAALGQVGQLYGEVDDTLLTTLAEFDHYPNRQQAFSREARGEIRYRGPWSMPGGEAPVWPVGGGRRIYAYLHSFSPGLPKILHALRSTGCPTIVFGGHDQQTQDRFAAPSICFEQRRLDLRQVAAECDAAVLNAGQATTIGFLLAGKPLLQVPIFLEGGINALNTERLGAGLMAFPRGEDRTAEQLAKLLNNPSYTEAARRFAQRYANFSADAEIAQAVARLNELTSGIM